MRPKFTDIFEALLRGRLGFRDRLFRGRQRRTDGSLLRLESLRVLPVPLREDREEVLQQGDAVGRRLAHRALADGAGDSRGSMWRSLHPRAAGRTYACGASLTVMSSGSGRGSRWRPMSTAAACRARYHEIAWTQYVEPSTVASQRRLGLLWAITKDESPGS